MNKFQTKALPFLLGRRSLRRAMMFLFGFFALLAVVTKPGDNGVMVNAQVSQKSISGEWVAEFDRAKPGEIYFMFQRRTDNEGFNMTSDNMPVSELQGLAAEALTSPKTNVNFNIIREAGTFQCEGYFSSGKGTGFWTLTINEKFVAALKNRGYDNLTGDDLLRAALHNLTIKFIEDLKNAGYDRVPFNDIVRAQSHDVDADYVKEVKAMGFERQPLETLIRMRNHEITAGFISEMKSAGFENLQIEELIRLKNHEITSQFINDLKGEGYSDVSAETAIRLKNHNVDRDFIRRAKAQGYNNVTLEELIRLSNRGVIK